MSGGWKRVLATWPDPEFEEENTEPEPFDPWAGGDDHSEEDLQRVREVANSD